MTAELQRLVDTLAERTDRPAVLEDRRQRMIVYSRHDEPLDRVRTESILRRRTTPEVVAWFRQFGIATARCPVRTPAAPDLGMLPRVCIPIHHDHLLLGFLWFVDADGSMSEEDVQLAAKTADDVALALYRENLAEELATNRETEAIRNLLAGESEVRAHAARELIESGQFDQWAGVTAVVALPVRDREAEPDELLRLAVEQALVETRRRRGPHETLHLVRYDHGLLLVADGGGDGEPEAGSQGFARTVLASLEQTARGLPAVGRIVVGVGGSRSPLDRACESYEEARQAASVAVHVPAAGPVAVWPRLGIYRALAHLTADQLQAASVHPGLDSLLSDPDATPLVDTLETYLDLAGNAQATSEQLNLHRTSLYYRLQKIEDTAATDLRDGGERLALHLGIKLARLTGRR